MSGLQQANAGTLENLVAEINSEHRACEAALRSGLAHALKAGELLIEAKTHTKHGEWGRWLAENFEGSVRTAQAYMRVARERPTLEGTNAQRVAHLSFRGALKELTSSFEEDEAENAFRAELLDLAERRDAILAEARPPAEALPEIVGIARRAEEIRAAKCEECIRHEREGGKLLLELEQEENQDLVHTAKRVAFAGVSPAPRLVDWRALASIPDDLFEQKVAELRARPWHHEALTERAMLRYARELRGERAMQTRRGRAQGGV
jgi:hypothetical protein